MIMTHAYDVHKCRAGETWDSLALKFYGSESKMMILLEFNPQYSSVLVFEGNEMIRVPVLEQTSTENIPDWRLDDED